MTALTLTDAWKYQIPVYGLYKADIDEKENAKLIKDLINDKGPHDWLFSFNPSQLSPENRNTLETLVLRRIELQKLKLINITISVIAITILAVALQVPLHGVFSQAFWGPITSPGSTAEKIGSIAMVVFFSLGLGFMAYSTYANGKAVSQIKNGVNTTIEIY